MCGIVGYIGTKPAVPALIDGLRRLEYRGYDSAGVAVAGPQGVKVVKKRGRVDDLDAALHQHKLEGSLGIGHTRWATHGAPSELNAHPHTSSDGRITLVHNGIIENYAEIRGELARKGIKCVSDTDTEVLANLIALVASEQNLPAFKATQVALKLVRGAYAIAVIDTESLDRLVLAKKSSPLAIGICDNGFVVGSDATPIVSHTQDVIYLNDDEVADLHRNGTYKVVSLISGAVTPQIHMLDIDINRIEKGGYPHFMLKEIHEQPDVVHETMRGRLSLDNGTVQLGGIIDYEQRILRAQRLRIIACGTSWHAGLVGKYLIEELAGIPVEVEHASEFRYRKPPLSSNDVVLAISQSGETADTLAAIELANEAGALTLGLVNVVGSSIARATAAGVYTHAGPEVSVASTKAFTTQVTVLTLMALRFAQQLGTRSRVELHQLYQELATLPEWVTDALQSENAVKDAAEAFIDQPVALFLGRGNCYPVALEGALKVKEITYTPCEGYPAGEMKHGPIALIDENTPVVVIVPPQSDVREKLLSNIQEVKARGAHVIAIAGKDDHEIARLANTVIPVPSTPGTFAPIITAVPLQLLAYYIATGLGRDVDKPRNLAKSVTVE